MASHTPTSRTFNTVKHSNREKRVKRHQQERVLLLAMCAVVIAILLTLAVLLVCNVVEAVKANRPEKPPVNNEQNQPMGQQEISYMSVTQANGAVKNGILQIVNKENEYLFPSTEIGLKVIFDHRAKVNGTNVYQINGNNKWKLQSDALDALNTMMTKYYELFEDNSISVTSAYRTAKDQEGKSVPPGFSDHHTGYCVALMDAAGTKELENDHWIYENCYKYGFIVRYPEGKSDKTFVKDYAYCFRYVGVAHATYIYQNNLCLEEYVDILKSTYTSSNHLKVTGADGNAYEIYYVPAGNTEITTLQVPKNYSYNISGDNMSGFIVTINLNAPINA